MKIRAIIAREWAETLRNRMVLMSILLPPLLFIAIPSFLLRLSDMDTLSPDTLDSLYALSPTLRAVNPQEATKLMLVNQFMLFFLMMPVFIPLTIAVQSIIGEKQSRTLEPLLATPVETWELLIGKSLAAAIPAIAITWGAFGIYFATTVPAVSDTLREAMLHPKWFLAIVVVAPLLCMLGVAMAVLLSSRMNDTRAAQQFGVVIVIPIVGLSVAQTAGGIFLGVEQFVVGSLALALINAVMLYMAVKVFDRETILTRWK